MIRIVSPRASIRSTARSGGTRDVKHRGNDMATSSRDESLSPPANFIKSESDPNFDPLTATASRLPNLLWGAAVGG